VGRIRYRHFSEGEYEKRVIQELLRENGAAGLNGGTLRITATRAEPHPATIMGSIPASTAPARFDSRCCISWSGKGIDQRCDL
jgi:hypothetical protein